MIAYLINNLDIRGGTHKQFLKLLDYTDRQGEPFFIITKKVDFSKTYPDFKRFEDRIRIFPFEKTGKSPLNLMRQIRALRRMVADADCINIHDGGFAVLLPALNGKKVVWQVNDMPTCFKVGVSANAKISFIKRLSKYYLVYCRRYITEFCVNVSKNGDRIKEAFKRDAHVFYCGIEPIDIKRNINDSLARFRNKKINILSSGVFLPYRNYETQVCIIEQLRNKGIDATLKIIGATVKQDYATKIQTMINEHNLSDYITICGQVDEMEFRRLHTEADVFMFINIDQSWGLAVFEAMSCGMPVIVSNSVGATEILNDGENSIFVEPKDSLAITEVIQNLMTNEEEYVRISDNAGKFHTQYTWDNAYCSKIFKLLH